MRAFHALVLATLLAAACGKQPAPTAPSPAKADPAGAGAAKASPPPPGPAAGGGMTVDEAGAKITALMEKIGTAVTSANGDCAKMGASLKLLTDEMKALMESGQSIDKDPAKRQEFDTKYGNKLMQQMESWMPAVQQCRDDPEVKAFFTSMG